MEMFTRTQADHTTLTLSSFPPFPFRTCNLDAAETSDDDVVDVDGAAHAFLHVDDDAAE